MPLKINEVGNRYGRLVVISKHPIRKHGHIQWVCKCDCGNTVVIRSINLRQGRTKSCGCLKKLPVGEAALRFLYWSYKRRAKRKDLEFSLTKEQFEEITKQNCYYCDQIPSQLYGNPRHNGKYIYNGIDRLDSSVGYVAENCVPCCKECNFAKGTKSEEEFLSWLDRIAKYQGYY